MMSTIPFRRLFRLAPGAEGTPRWMSWVLLAAAVYNLVWGGLVVLFPHALFDWMGMDRPNYPELWQCVGMIVGVYGVGYGLAARDPLTHWPIVLVGLLGKILGPIGFVEAVWRGAFPLAFGYNILTNDLIWWVPFGAILLHAWREAAGEEERG
ncbi:MAG: alkyl hydroperoxide reductase [Blastocatellia bacterium]